MALRGTPVSLRICTSMKRLVPEGAPVEVAAVPSERFRPAVASFVPQLKAAGAPGAVVPLFTLTVVVLTTVPAVPGKEPLCQPTNQPGGVLTPEAPMLSNDWTR